MPSPTQRRGALHESVAERVLVARGYRILERNWRGGGAEVDRIAWVDEVLCFVEVRSRVGEASGSPEASVGRAKRLRLVRAARAFLTRFPPGRLPMVRFDVVGVVLSDAGEVLAVRVVEDAFDEAGRP